MKIPIILPANMSELPVCIYEATATVLETERIGLKALNYTQT